MNTIHVQFIIINVFAVTALSLRVEISSFKSKDLWILSSFPDNINYCTLTYFHAFINTYDMLERKNGDGMTGIFLFFLTIHQLQHLLS